MSLLIALVLAQASAVADPPPAEDIVVLAERLKKTRFVWNASDKSGAWKLKACKIKQSSGDKAVDAITCRAVELCLPTMPLGAKRAPDEFHACVFQQRNALIEDLAARRSAQRDKQS